MGVGTSNRLELLGDRALIEAAFTSIIPVLPPLPPSAIAARATPMPVVSEEERRNWVRACQFSELEGVPISLNMIDPCPSEEWFLEKVRTQRASRTGWRRWAGAIYDWWYPQTKDTELFAVAELQDRWQLDHWGTNEVFAMHMPGRIGNSQVFVTGDPPIKAMRTLSRKFPALTVILEWFSVADYEPSRIVLQDGVGSEKRYEMDSQQGVEILHRLGLSEHVREGGEKKEEI